MKNEIKTKKQIEKKIREILSKDVRFCGAKIEVILRSKSQQKL